MIRKNTLLVLSKLINGVVIRKNIMSNILNLKGVKLFAIIVLAVAVLATFGMVAVQKASADCSINSTLRVGSTGAEVVCLQTALGGLTADGSFGPMTKAAVVSWQSNSGLAADGVFGPLSRAVWMANAGNSANFPAGCTSATGFSTSTGLPCTGGVSNLPAGCSSTSGFSPTTGMACNVTSNLPAGCSSTSGFSPTTGMSCSGGPSTSGPLAGNAGTISDVNNLSTYNNEEVGDGSNDVKVAGFEVEASNDGDIALNSVKISFASTGNGATESDRIEDYLDSVSIMMGSTVVGTVSAADFNKDSTGNYSKVITLSNAVVRSDTLEKFYITVDAVTNLDSGDIVADSWSVDLENIRYTDGSGVTTTDVATGVINAMNVGIAFVTFSSSADTELKISLNNTPEAGVVDVDASNNTDDVVLLKGKLKLDGTSDVWLDALPITFTAATTTGSINAITGSVKLTLGNNTYTEVTGTTNCLVEADFSTPSTCSTEAQEIAGILFDNLDYTITAGSTVNFTVSADINDLDATATEDVEFDAGDSLKADLTVAGRAFVVAENSQGDQLANATEMTGSALGEAQVFRDTGIQVSLVSTTADVALGASGSPDLGTYTITFDVTSFGGDMWVDGTKPTLTGADSIDLDIVPATGGTGTQDAVITSPTSATMTGTINTTSRFLVSEGETERFTITSVVTPTVAGGLYSVALASLAFDDADINLVDATNIEYTTNLVDFVSPSVNLKLTN